MAFSLTSLALPFLATPLAQQMPSQGGDPRQALLAQLNEVIAPQAHGWWPPAPGWWVLACAAVALIAFSVYQLREYYLRTRYRAYALKQLERSYHSDDASAHKAQQIMIVLKRAFFSVYPHSRNRFAGEFGQQWIQLLQQILSKKYDTAPVESSIEFLLYQNSHDHHISENIQALDELYKFAKHWLKHHRRTFPAAARQEIAHA